MLIDVGSPLRNLLLNACFWSIAFLALMALVPWKSLGVDRASRMARGLPAPALALAVAYEVAMPSQYDIRVDLLLLLPLYGLILLTSLVRWVASRRAASGAEAGNEGGAVR